MAGIASRAIGMISPIVTIPMALHHLGEQTFGLWMTISAMIGVLAFADLGFGQTILSDVGRALGQGLNGQVKKILSTAYGGIGIVVVCLLPFLTGASLWIDWGKQFGIADPSKQREAAVSILIACVLFMANVLAGLIYKIQIASQKAVQANIWQAGGNLLGMGLIILVIRLKLPLPFVVAAFLGGPLLAWVANSWWFFGTTGRKYRPSFGSVDSSMFRALIRHGVEFLIVGALLNAANAIDMLLVSKILGLKTAAVFSIAVRVSSMLTLATSMMYMPLWAANAEALGRGDIDWVRKTVRRMTFLCPILTFACGLPILIWSNQLFSLWLREPMPFSSFLLLGVFAWALLQGASSPRFMVLNSTLVVRAQILMQIGFLLCGLPIKLFLLKKYGIEALPWVNFAVYAIAILPPLEWLYRRALLRQIAQVN